jgi:hypothetical protein
MYRARRTRIAVATTRGVSRASDDNKDDVFQNNTCCETIHTTCTRQESRELQRMRAHHTTSDGKGKRQEIRDEPQSHVFCSNPTPVSRVPKGANAQTHQHPNRGDSWWKQDRRHQVKPSCATEAQRQLLTPGYHMIDSKQPRLFAVVSQRHINVHGHKERPAERPRQVCPQQQPPVGHPCCKLTGTLTYQQNAATSKKCNRAAVVTQRPWDCESIVLPFPR